MTAVKKSIIFDATHWYRRSLKLHIFAIVQLKFGNYFENLKLIDLCQLVTDVFNFRDLLNYLVIGVC